MKEIVTNLEKIREIAFDQYGFITTEQAIEKGLAKTELARLATRGRIKKIAYGLYRVGQVAATPYDEWAMAIYWTRREEACLSCETALSAWSVSDVNPQVVHVTVDSTQRIRRKTDKQIVVHYQNKEPQNRTWWQGLPITDLPTTIADCIDYGTPTYLLVQALERGKKARKLKLKEFRELTRRLEQRDGNWQHKRSKD